MGIDADTEPLKIWVNKVGFRINKNWTNSSSSESSGGCIGNTGGFDCNQGRGGNTVAFRHNRTN